MANNDFLDFSQWAVKQPDVAANEPAMPDFSNQAVAPAAPAKTEVPQPKAPDFSDKAVTPAPVKDPAAPDWELAWEREARLNKAVEPEAPKPAKKGPSSFTGIDSIIDNAARENGVDTNLLRTFAQIESGGRPSVQTGSYKGLFQLSNREFNNHGGTGDIFDPVANAQAGARKLKAESDQFKSQFGRTPTGPELYMIHQQGWGGAQQHWANPDQPAWQSMYSTAEGRQKGPRWAKQAIWGNVPDDVKRKFGSVDNMSSRDFTQMWADKYNRIGSRFGVMAENAPAQTGNSIMKEFMTAQPEQRQEILERKIEEIVGGEIPEFAAARRARQEQQRAADPATLDFSQFAVPDQKGAAAPGQKTDAKKAVPDPAHTAFGLPKRDKLLPQEDSFFKSNPTMGGMAAEDGSVIINPYAKMSDKEKKAVEFNEAARLYMKNNQFIPEYQLTPQQVAQFKGTPYEGDVKAMRETVAARVLAGDPSIKDATPEQKKFVDDYLRPFVDGGKDGFVGAVTDPQQYLEGAKGIVPGAGRMAALGVQGINALNPVRAVDLNSQKYVEDLRRVPSMSPKELSEFRQRVAKEPANLTRDAVQGAISDILDPDGTGIGAKGGFKDVNAYVDARFGVTPMEETVPYKAGESIKKWVDDIEAFKPKAGYEKAILRQGGEGLGSMVGGLPFALLGPVPATVFFASAGSGEAIDRAVQWSKKEKEAGRPGLTEQQISSAGLMGIAPGATDIVPIETLMGRLPIPVPAPIRKALAAGVAKIGGKAFMEGLGRVSGQAAVEGGQEALQSFLQDVIAKTYDPNQVLGETILPEAGLGAGVGGFAQAAKEVGAGIIKSAANRRGGHASAPEPAPEEGNLEKQKQIEGSEQKQIAGADQKQADVPPSAKQIAQEIKLPDQRVKEPAKADTPVVGKTPTPREVELLKSQNWSDEDIADMGDEERADAVADAVAQGATSELADDEPTAEPIRDLKAQAEDLRNPDNGRAAVWLPKSSADALARDKSASGEILGSGVAIEDFDGKGGTLIARDEQAAQDAIARRDDGVPIQTIVGEMTGSGTGKLPNADTVVQQLTKDGAVARESAVPADQAEATAQSFAAPDRDVWVGTLSEALAKRDEAASADAVKVGRRDAPVNVLSPDDVAAASQRITEPSPKQAEAGNYAKGHVKFNGLDISIETPKGGTRRGYDEEGNPSWEVPDMPASYGYIKRSTGADGEQIDVYIGDNPKSDRVYLVDQVDADTGKFDEHKAILGTDSLEEAGNLYSRGFSDGRGPDRIGDITEMSVSEFKDWVRSGPQDAPYSDTLSSPSSQAEPATDDNANALDFSDYAIPGSSVDADAAEDELRSWGDRINEGRVIEALKGLEKRPNDWVSLSDLRGSLGSPDEQSWRNAMRDMLDSNDIALTINEDPRSITDQDRTDSVRIGGKSMHFVRRMTDGEKVERGEPKDQISQDVTTKTVKPKLDLIEPPSRYDGDSLSDMEIDGIVDAWRYVQEMNRKQRPQTLTKFVIDNGGLVDDGGEIKHIAGGYRERPGLINKNGQTLDDMALRAWQSGFLPGSGERPTISEFLDALDDDLLNGNIVREQDWEELENFKYADEAAQEIAEYGVNVSRFRSEASLREYFGQQRPRNSGAVEADQEEASTTKEREGGAGSAAVIKDTAVTTEEDGQTSFVAPPTVKEKIDAASAKKDDKPEQKPMDEGLFGSDKDQLDLVDAAKTTAPAKNEKETADDKEEASVAKDKEKLEPHTVPDGKTYKTEAELQKAIESGEVAPVPENDHICYRVAGQKAVSGGYDLVLGVAGGNIRHGVARTTDGKWTYEPQYNIWLDTKLLNDVTEGGFVDEHIMSAEQVIEFRDRTNLWPSIAMLDEHGAPGYKDYKEPSDSDTDAPKAIGFTTAKGSKYKITPEGKTIRDKAARSDQGHEGDSGIKPVSEHTFYVDEQAANELSLHQTHGGSGTSIVQLDAKRIGVKYIDGKDAGKFEKRTVVPFSKEPSVGAIPVETWKDGVAVHFGNKIVSVEHASADEIEPASTSPQPSVDGNALRDRIIKDGFKDIREARKFAKENGFKESSDKEIDEAIEQAVVDAAKLLTLDGKKTEREIYQGMVNLYGNQPNLGVRTSTSVANQAYSTPVPLAYLAARLAGTRTANVVYEPTAGNGALLIDVATPNNVFANELDPKRAAALEAQGYRTTTLDATEPAQAKAIRETKDGADSVIMNPPFGAVREDGKSKSWDVDGFKTSTVDHAIAITALEAMADDGKAVLILGGVNAVDVAERRTGYRGQAKRQFFARLYRDYNVVDHFTVDGDLYRKQGAGWPVDVVVIDGRGKSAIPLPAANPPVILSSWSDLEGKLPNADAQANEGKARKDRKPAGSPVEAEPRPISGDATGSGEAPGGRPRGSDADVKNEPVSVRGDGDRGKSGDVRPGEGSKADAASGESTKPGRANKPSPAPRGERVAPPEGSGQALYHPTSNAQSLESLVPSNMARATKDAVERIAKKHGGVDEYVAKALNYDVDRLSDYFSAEQIDAIAASIDNIGKGAAFIIGDQCVAGSTRIYDPEANTFTPIKELAQRKKSIRVLALTPKGFVVASATAPFRKGEADLYRVVLDDGRKITVTRQHRFLTGDGWKTLEDGLRVGHYLASAEGHLLNNLGGHQSVHHASDRRSIGTVLDYQDDCSAYSCHDGEQLRADRGAAQSSVPSPADVLERIRCCSLTGEWALSLRHNHRCPGIDHRSKNSSSPLEVLAPSRNDTRGVSFRVSMSPSTLGSERPVHGVQASLLGEDAKVRQRQCGDDAFGLSLLDRDVSRHSSVNDRVRSEREHLAPWLSALSSAPKDTSSRFDLNGLSFGDHTGWRRIVSIDHVGYDEFFDMWVPGFENYMAEGLVNHNTGIGKGRVVAAMIRYAMIKKWVPLFVTEKPDLYGDMFRDMTDIGIDEMLGHEPRAFLTNTGASVPLDEKALQWKSDVDDWSSAREAESERLFDTDYNSLNAAQRAELKKTFSEPKPKQEGRFLKAGTNEKQLVDMHAIANGSSDYEMVFTTYDQMSTIKKQETERRNFIRQITPNSLLILDESHNAGGQGQGGWAKSGEAMNRADFVRDLKDKAKGVLYSSATFAKRPDVMDLYARTDMGKAVDDPKKLPALIQRGGVPMQQIVATMLSDSGQYMRRERSFEGVEYGIDGVPVNSDTYSHLTNSVRSIFQFDRDVTDFRDAFMEEILDSIGAVKSKDSGVGEATAYSTNFASMMHNIINQMLLSVTSDQVAEKAIQAVKNGEKPIIALSNTMESFVSDYADDAGVKIGGGMDITFGNLLKRYLDRTLRITVKTEDDKKEHHSIPLKTLPSHLRKKYAEIEKAINEGTYTMLPVSPIDWVRHRLSKAGVSVAEVTGRSLMINYSGNEPTLAKRPKSEMGPTGKRASIAAFNRGSLDALILNRSGSTGVSMHASSKFKDQRRRRMIIQQADPNVDTHLQMLGRVHRTGQVIPPVYSQIAAEIPASVRPTAILMKKMASLNANTTGARGSAFMADATDFMNEVGDKIVANIIMDDPEINDALGNPLKENNQGVPIDDDAARRVTGRLVLLDPKSQSELLDRIQDEYTAEIARLDALGENMLEAKTVDLQAKVLEETTVRDSQGEGPFLEAVKVQKVSAKAQGRAMAPDEIATKIAAGIDVAVPAGGVTNALQELERQGRQAMDKKAVDINKRVREWIASEVSKASGDAKASTRERHNKTLERWNELTSIAAPGARVVLDTDQGQMSGIVMTVERSGKTKNLSALGAWQVTIAVPDSVRSITFPMSKLFTANNPKGSEETGAFIDHSKVPTSGIMSQLEDARREGRETRYIVTGNILAGYEQVKGKGRIVNYTTEDGSLRPGILMGRDFELSKFMDTRSVRFKSADQVMTFLTLSPMAEVRSVDGFVTMSRNRGAWRISMPSSRATGGRYYTDKRVRDALGHLDFRRVSGVMSVELYDTGTFTKVVDAMRSIGAVFETTEDQSVAQETARIGVDNDASADAQASFSVGTMDRFEEVRAIIKSGQTYSVPAWHVADQMSAVRENLHLVPKDTHVGVLYEVEPLKDRTHDVDDPAVSLNYITPDGRKKTLTMGLNKSGIFRAFTLPRSALGGRPGIFLHNFEFGSNTSQAASGQVWHESVHVLRRDRLIAGDKWNRLLRHSNNLRILDMKMRDVARAVGDPKAENTDGALTVRQLYNYLYEGRGDERVELVRQESVTHMIELWHHGAISDEEMAPVKDILDEMGSGKLSGNRNKFSEIDEMFGAFAAEAPTVAPDIDSLGYYSGLLRAAYNLRQEKGTPEQMLSMLRKDGAKEAEVDASDLDLLFKGKTSVTKSQIIDHIRSAKTDISENVYSREDIRFTAINEELERHMAEWREEQEEDYEFDRDRSLYEYSVEELADKLRGFAEDNNLSVDEDLFDDNPIEALEKSGLVLVTGQIQATSEVERYVIATAGDKSALFSTNGAVSYGKNENELIDELESEIKYSMPIDETFEREQTQADLENEYNVDDHDPTKWSKYSLDPDNITYKETVLSIPAMHPELRVVQTGDNLWRVQNRITGEMIGGASYKNESQALGFLERRGSVSPQFRSQHFPQSNIVGHMLTSSVKHDGRGTYLLDQIQSDWGQKVRDGGLVDHKKVAVLKKTMQDAMSATRRQSVAIDQFVAENKEFVPDAVSMLREYHPSHGGSDFQALTSYGPLEIQPRANELADELKRLETEEERISAELWNAQQGVEVSHPLVNTTDQWVNTTLRRVIRQAVDSGAEFIAIPSGKTVEGYNPQGDSEGNAVFYDQIVPKNLRNLLRKIDKKSPDPIWVNKLKTPTSGMQGDGFKLFEITDKVKQSVVSSGQPMFAASPQAATLGKWMEWSENLGDKQFQISDRDGKSYTVNRVGRLGSITYMVKDGARPIGSFYVRTGGSVPGTISVMNAVMDQAYQRRGIASAIYDAIEADTAPGGRDLYPQGTFSLSPDGRAFWQARDPAKLEAMEKAESEPGYAYGQSIKVALDRPAQGRLKASISDAIEIVQRIAGSGVAIDFKSQMPASAARRAVDEMRPFRDVGRAGDVIGGFYRPKSAHLEALIGLSVEAPGFDLRTAAGHEAWHHVERVFATDDELNLLYSRAEQERMRNVAAVELGLDPRKPRDATLLAAMPPVEVTAWAFQRYRRLREEGLQDMSGLHIAVRRLFNRIYKILNNIKAAVKGEGLTYEKIFESARSGEMAKRAPRQGSSNQDPGVAAADAIKANAELMAQAIPGIENIIQSVVDRAANTNDDVATQAGLFVDQYIIVEDGQDVSDVDMYDAYKYWAKNANVDIIDADTFHRALISNGGLWRVKIGGRARYHGVRIATMVERKKADASALMAPEKRTLAQDIAQGASFSTALTRLIETMKAKVSGKTARQAAKEIADVNRLISIQDKIASSNDNDVDRTMADNVYSMFDSPDILAMAVASGPSGTRPMTWLERHTRRLFDRVSVRSDAIRVKIQDKALPIKRLAVERLEAETGTKVAASLDTYLREGLYSGRAGERMVDLEQDYVEPMIEHMRKAGISLEEAGDYVYARHARERNAWISLINPDLMDGGSGMTNAEADQILADVRASGKQADMDRAAQYVDDMIEKSRKDLLKSGLINRETFDAWSMKYASYVPLRGFELGEAENPDFPRVGRGYDVRGRESMQALGRRSKADNPIIYAVQQAQQAIVRAEKNRVNKTLYNAVQSYPNDGFWKVYVGEVRKRFNPSTGLVEEYFMPPDFVRRDDVIGVKLNGKQKWIEIKHPDLVRSIRGVGSDVSGTALGRAVHKVMRTYAGLLTSWNPEFVFSNFFRDMQTALINSTGLANKPVGIRRRIAKDALSTASIRGALAAIRNHEGRTIFGTHRAADETILGTKRSTTAETYAKYYDEFRLAGGKVSFIEFNDVERIRNKTLTALNSGRVRRGLRSAAEAIETLNTAVENGVRLSTYASLRDAGVSQDEAAFIAKELTVNFNRKGEWGPGINSMYLFFNASVQGIARMAMAIGTSKHVRYALGGIFAMGAMLDMLNYLVGGDDDDGKNRYDKIPEWIKERNIIIMNPWGDGNYMMIPMPYGYNAPFVAGREAMGVYRGASPAGPAASRVLLATIEAFNPLGSAGSFLQYASPTLLDPAVQIMENKTFFGGPIMPTKFKETKPDSQVYFDSAPSWAKWVARTLNSASGGDIGRPGQIDISPETFEHWAEFAGGGTAKFFFNAEATAERFVNGEEWLPEKTPMIRRLYGRQDSVVSRKREFYDAWREVEQTNDQIKTLITHGERDAANEARATHDADVKAYGAMKAARNQLKTLRKQRTMIENNETMDAADKKKRLDEIMEREKQAITRSLKVYEDAKKIQKD